MKQRAAIASIFIVAVFAATMQLEAGRPRVGAGCGTVKSSVYETLASEPQVSVLISLHEAPRSNVDLVRVSDLQANAALRQERVLARLDGTDLVVSHQYTSVAALAGLLSADGAAKLDCDVDVASVELNLPMTLALGESAPLIKADDPVIIASNLDGTGVDVAVLDSGIDTDHVDLANNIIGTMCTTEPGFCAQGSNPAQDEEGHGTHVSGIITSNGNVAPRGVAPNADIFAYRITSNEQTFPHWVLAALDDILTNHVTGGVPEFEFINMSFRIPPGLLDGPCPEAYHSIDNAIKDLYALGTLTFAAAGNSGSKSEVEYPACYTHAIAVGAVYDANLGSQTHGFVPCTDGATHADKVTCFSQSSDSLDLLAPGANISSTQPDEFQTGFCSGDTPVPVVGRDTCLGTSMATPHAVGVAALLKQAMPTLTPEETTEILTKTGRWVKGDLNDSDPNTFRWTPRVDARVALLTDDDADYDLDGCTNGREFGTDPGQGGVRNALDGFDYYDVNHDGTVAIGADILAVSGAFGTSTGPRYIDHKDRGDQVGPNSWNRAGPDGAIANGNDILVVGAQFGHNCPHTDHSGQTPFGPHPRSLSAAVSDTKAAPYALLVNSTAGYASSGQVLIDSGTAETMTYDQNAGTCGGSFNPATQFCVTARGTAVAHGAGTAVFQKP